MKRYEKKTHKKEKKSSRKTTTQDLFPMFRTLQIGSRNEETDGIHFSLTMGLRRGAPRTENQFV